MWLFHHNNGGPCVPTQPVTIYTTCDHKLVSKPVTVDKELTHLPFQQIVKPLTFFFNPLLGSSSSWCIFQLYFGAFSAVYPVKAGGRCISARWPMYLCRMANVFVQAPRRISSQSEWEDFSRVGQDVWWVQCCVLYWIRILGTSVFMFTNADIHFENLIFENWNETQHFKTWTWIKLKIATPHLKNQWEVGDRKNYDDDDSVDDGEFECSWM